MGTEHGLQSVEPEPHKTKRKGVRERGGGQKRAQPSHMVRETAADAPPAARAPRPAQYQRPTIRITRCDNFGELPPSMFRPNMGKHACATATLTQPCSEWSFNAKRAMYGARTLSHPVSEPTVRVGPSCQAPK